MASSSQPASKAYRLSPQFMHPSRLDLKQPYTFESHRFGVQTTKSKALKQKQTSPSKYQQIQGRFSTRRKTVEHPKFSTMMDRR